MDHGEVIGNIRSLTHNAESHKTLKKRRKKGFSRLFGPQIKKLRADYNNTWQDECLHMSDLELEKKRSRDKASELQRVRGIKGPLTKR